jgi:uncharacterized protein (DUF1697 family)
MRAMPVYVALLRGINVGKHRRVAMADIRTALTGAGFENVSTYIASGNVVLESGERSAAAVERSVEDALHEAIGIEIPTIVRTEAQLAKILATNPFLDRGAEPARLHVAFLKGKPSAAEAKALAAVEEEPDELVVRGAEIYLHYPDGQGRSRMAVNLARAMKTPGTVRTWKVVGKLRARAGAL